MGAPVDLIKSGDSESETVLPRNNHSLNVGNSNVGNSEG